ncbi:MAG: AMP-binding protein [Gemmatimonadetes bacterium]|nr:AMP-binding protein [Gemmatimonadota bacterium]
MSSTLPGLLARRAAETPDAVALREKEFGIWREIAWGDYGARVRAFALGLLELGVDRGDRVAIIGDNRPEWMIAELAAQSVGAVPVGLYQDSIVDEVVAMLRVAEPAVVVAEDQEQVDKMLEAKERVASVTKIVYHDAQGLHGYRDRALTTFGQVERAGSRRGSERPGEFADRLGSLSAHDTALLSATSGTTSVPKLAELSHANLLAMAAQLRRVDPAEPEDEFVSFLPLAWIGEQMVGVASSLLVGFKVNFPESAATARADMREIGPAFLMSPPRIWEGMVSDIQVLAEDTTPFRRKFFDWAMERGEEVRLSNGGPPGLWSRTRLKLADLLVLGRIRDQLGLGRVKRAYTGGAALGPDVFRFFHAVGVNLKQLYGQTEVSGISVVHRDGDIRFHTVGTPFPETEIRISEEGEILCRSPAVFKGYFRNPEATREAFADGWLRSGDAGYLEEDGHLVVIDRLADVMKLPDGSVFSPQFVENKIKFSPYVREAVVFGGGDAPFVTALVAIDPENVGQWAERRGIPYTTFTDLALQGEVRELVRAHATEVNRELPEPARIRRFLLLHKELHADDAELTRTRKVRRRHIADRFGELIAALRSDEESVRVSTRITYQDGRTATVSNELRICDLRVAPPDRGAYRSDPQR